MRPRFGAWGRDEYYRRSPGVARSGHGGVSMRLDSAPAHAQPVSPATWCALAVLLLLLSALGLFLMGCDRLFGLSEVQACPAGTVSVGDVCTKPMPPANYYACECECTKGFSIGAHIQSQDVNVRDAPAGNLIDHAPAGALGTILDGPQQADLNGTSETWWKIHWDTGVQDGWSVQSLLSVVSSDTLVVKDLQVCLPPSLNVNLPGGQAPTPPDITDDCSTSRVAPEFLATTGPLPAGSQCACRATTFPTMWVAECDATCTAPSGVCLVSGSDPEQATPDPLAAGVFTPTSVCQVSGTATIVVAGHEPKKQPNARGLLQIQGKPCPAGQGCQVGMSYQLRADDIEFDSGTIFADDPKFVDLSLSGATQPNAIDLGVLLGFDIGDVRSGTALTSASGRRSGSSDRFVALFRNTQSVALAVNWASKACRLSGPLVGQIQGDQNDGTLDIHVDVALDGVL